MKKFSYRACTSEGVALRGTLAAESASEAVRILAAEGKTVLRLREQRDFRLPDALRLQRGITAEERIAFLHELAALLGAGLPVHEALARLSDGERGTAYTRMTAALYREVVRGMPLSQAMEMQGAAFPASLIGMVRAGEESGMLETILHDAADVLTEAHVLRESLRSALAYPLFLLAATVFSMFLMTVFILPIFAALLRDFGTEAPLPTRMMLALSDTLAAHPYALTAAVIVGCLAVPLLLAQPVLRLHADALLLRVPVLGTFLRLAMWQMILRTLAILLRSGIRLDRAVALARAMTGNRALADQLGRMERNLVEGRTFAQVIARAPYVPQILRGMLAAGEAAGELDRLLQHGADYCRRRAAAYSARMEALTEPVMVVLVAALIFFVVLSVLLPIFDTMDALM